MYDRVPLKNSKNLAGMHPAKFREKIYFRENKEAECAYTYIKHNKN
jgi:hypothetical protein